MTLKINHQMKIAGFNVSIIRKKMKSMRMSVMTDGVKISVPTRTPLYHIEAFVKDNTQWIHKSVQEARDKEVQRQNSLRDGAIFSIWGERFSMGSVVGQHAKAQVYIDASKIIFCSPVELAFDARQLLLDEYLRADLKRQVTQRLEYWQQHTGISIHQWGVKKMKTRWGSCNIECRRIWLNLDLARWPCACLDYVIVHELTHLLEARHNQRFWSLVESFMPTWQIYHQMLKGPIPI